MIRLTKNYEFAKNNSNPNETEGPTDSKQCFILS